MKKLSLPFLLLILYSGFLLGQKKDILLGVESLQGISWSDREESQARYINTLGLCFDYEVFAGIYLGTGIGINKVGYARESVEDFVVITFIDNFGLPFQRSYEGEILTRRKLKYRFYQIPLRLRIRLLNTQGFELLLHNSVSWNIYKDDQNVSWYWYKTANEVKTDNRGKVTGFKGSNLGFTTGVDLSRIIFDRIHLSAGLHFHKLFFESKAPSLQEQIRFNNLGFNLGLKYNFAN